MQICYHKLISPQIFLIQANNNHFLWNPLAFFPIPNGRIYMKCICTKTIFVTEVERVDKNMCVFFCVWQITRLSTLPWRKYHLESLWFIKYINYEIPPGGSILGYVKVLINKVFSDWKVLLNFLTFLLFQKFANDVPEWW